MRKRAVRRARPSSGDGRVRQNVNIETGSLLAFGDYLERARRPKLAPVLWRARDISAAVEAEPGSGRGSVALSQAHPDAAGAVAPGLSLTIQSVQAGVRVPPHQHSFWHLYTVLGGSGGILLEDNTQPLALALNDWIFVPAWCTHALDNSSGSTPLVLAALQNLPQNAAIGSLLRQEQDDVPQVVYANAAL